MNAAVIINQSQQKGKEWVITQMISQCLFNKIRMNDKIGTELVPCYRLTDQNSSDGELLTKSVDEANRLYELYRSNGFTHDQIIQIDIHQDSYNKLATGISAFWLPGSVKGMKFANMLYNSELGDILGRRTLEARSDFYTLKKSDARNVLFEVGFYDTWQGNWTVENCCKVTDILEKTLYSYFGL